MNIVHRTNISGTKFQPYIVMKTIKSVYDIDIIINNNSNMIIN